MLAPKIFYSNFELILKQSVVTGEAFDVTMASNQQATDDDIEIAAAGAANNTTDEPLNNQQPTEEVSKNHPDTRTSVRKRTLTEKGMQYQFDSLKQNYDSECRKIRRQCDLMRELYDSYNSNLINQELANLDKRLSDAEDVHSRLMSLLSEEDKLNQQNQHDKIDQLVFDVKKKACQLLKQNEGSSVRSRSRSSRSSSHDSKRSGKSHRSNKSNVSNISKLDSLKAEEEALEEVQRARKEELDCMLRLESAKMEAQRTRLHQKIVKAQSQENPHTSHESKHNSQSNKRDKHTSKQLQPDQSTASTCNLNDIMTKLVDLHMSHSAPDIDIDVFSGNPLDYCYFRATFRDVVEQKVLDPRGRLTRLLKYTKGDAKDLIKHCIYEDENECFDQAIQLLDEEYGNKQILVNTYLKELRQWPSIKTNAACVVGSLIRRMVNCRN